MKYDNIFPLERNNYFFGKLMTEHEYTAEQTYFNNKRRLINAAFFSPGIVCGLTVTKADGVSVAVESGLALDGLGRELAVPNPVLTRLSWLDGFTGDQGMSPYVYLCAEYAEEQIAPVQAVTSDAEGTKFGRVRETVRLFLSYAEPDETDKPCVGTEYREENLEKNSNAVPANSYISRRYISCAGATRMRSAKSIACRSSSTRRC